jgi:hypothetical protein
LSIQNFLFKAFYIRLILARFIMASSVSTNPLLFILTFSPDLISQFSSLLNFCVRNKEALGTIAALIGVAAKGGPFLVKYFRLRKDRKTLHTRIGAELYTVEEINRATSFYIEPDCQSIDPSGGEDFRKVYAVRQNAFESLDKLFGSSTEHRHTLVLADSGMGKTSLLLNYYARHWRNNIGNYKIAILPLGRKNVDARITEIQDRSDTVLFLDAFDEDTVAIDNHRERLRVLLDLTEGFYHVLITCRTQFFEKDTEIPKETGLVRFGVTAAGQEREYMFYKLYLSPFSDGQVKIYLRRRFPFWRFRQREKALEIAAKMPDLTIRPMLLAHIQDLLGSTDELRYTVQIYEAMIAAWLIREQAYVNPANLRRFSEFLAADIYSNRQQRGSERIPSDDALKLASRLAMPLQGWQLRGRSLLNRDAEGNLKFAHRTLMEYLFVRHFSAFPNTIAKTEWTDQMKRFWWELVIIAWRRRNDDRETGGPFGNLHKMPALQIWDEGRIFSDLKTADLEGLEVLHLPPFIKNRVSPKKLSEPDLLEGIRHGATLNESYRRWYKNFPGFFRHNEYEGPTGTQAAVVDHITGLMWADTASQPSSYLNALRHAEDLRRSKWAGYSDWRLPTLPESLSLLATSSLTVHLNPHQYPYSLFKFWENNLWLSDADEHAVPLSIDYGSEKLVRIGAKEACLRVVRQVI